MGSRWNSWGSYECYQHTRRIGYNSRSTWGYYTNGSLLDNDNAISAIFKWWKPFFIGQNQPYYSTIITPSSLYPGESVHSTIITPSSLYPGESVNTNVLSQIPTNILLADESLVGKLLDKAIQALDESEQQSSSKPKPKIKPKFKSKQEQFREEIEARLDADTTAKQLLQQRQDLIEAETRATAREIKQLLESNQVEVAEMQKLREQQQIMIEEARKNAKEMAKLQERQEKYFKEEAEYQIQERKRLEDFEVKVRNVLMLVS